MNPKMLDEGFNRRYMKKTLSENVNDDYELAIAEDSLEIIDNFDPIATTFEKEGDYWSVCIKDLSSDECFWVDVSINDKYHDVDCDWNQYIFQRDNYKDAIHSAVQDDDNVFDLATSEAIGYLEQQGEIKHDSSGWYATSSNEVTEGCKSFNDNHKVKRLEAYTDADEDLDDYAREAYSLLSYIDPYYDSYMGDIDPEDSEMGDSFYTHEDWVNEMKYQLLSGDLLEYWSETLEELKNDDPRSYDDDYHENKIRIIQDFLNRVKAHNFVDNEKADEFLNLNESLKEKLSLKDVIGNKIKDVKAYGVKKQYDKDFYKELELKDKLDAIKQKTGGKTNNLGNMKDEYTKILTQMKGLEDKRNQTWDKYANLKNSKEIDYDKVDWDSDNPFDKVNTSAEGGNSSLLNDKKDLKFLQKQQDAQEKSNQEKYYDELSKSLTQWNKSNEKSQKVIKNLDTAGKFLNWLGKTGKGTYKRESLEESYNEPMFFKAFITNLGKYNEGELVGNWVEFPIDEDDFEEELEKIGIGSTDDFGQPYEEWFVTDYDTNLPNLSDELGEYPGYDRLQEIGEMVQGASDIDPIALENVMEVADSLEEAIDGLNDGTINFYKGIDSYEELAEYVIDEWYGGIENFLKDSDETVLYNNFDFDRLGRDLRLDFYDPDYETAGEYWCGDPDALDSEIGEAFVEDVGFEGVANPEYYFDYDSWGSDLKYDGFTITSDGCVEMQ